MTTQVEPLRLAQEQIDLLPSNEDVAFYREHGWYHSKKILTDEVIEEALTGSERYYAGERDAPLPDGTMITGWTPDQGDKLRKNDYSSLQNRELAKLVRHPLIAAVAARLSGSPLIRMWHDQLLYKPPDKPDRKANVGWHTDRGYWKTCTSANMITAWVPLHDCDEGMGTIIMIDGSHRWPDNTMKLNFFSNDLEGLEREFITGGRPVVKVPMNLKKGEVSFHHCLTIHGSGPNRSPRPRRSVAIHMQDDSNCYQECYISGHLAKHPNDNFCRKLDGHPDYTDPAVCPVLWGE